MTPEREGGAGLAACLLWKDPEAAIAKGLRAQFERLETFVEDSHWWRYLLQCRGCGQRYVFEFYEEVDWAGGQDPQFSTWVPVDTDEQIAAVRAAAPRQLSAFTPRLCRDWPKGRDAASVYWVR
ncbi:MAG: hypothetical protein H6842_11295 [Rhodospirillaceae bacterium]|nr:hypothetical protein [Rhodospirillaceae bacterium]